MNKRVKKTLKITGISLASLLIVSLAAIALALHFIFTPAKLTPFITQAANHSLNARVELGSVDLTFFSTFPRFGLRVTDGTLVSKALRDTMWQRRDTLLTFKKAALVVNPIDYLTKKKITLYRLTVDSARIYAHIDKEGRANWDILPDSTDTTAADSASTDTTRLAPGGIDIRRVALRHAIVTFDDRQARVFANLWDANLGLQASLHRGHSMLKLDYSNRNILFWQDGELLVNRVSAGLKTDLELDRRQRTLTLNNALLDINGLELDLKGTLRRDTTARAADVDLHYSLHAPSIKTVIGLIPQSILKKGAVDAAGEVQVDGTLKGLYGKGHMPLATLKVNVNQASAHYEGMPYGIDEITADFTGQVDLMKQQPSYADLKIFHFKGAKTDILADARIGDLLGDPDISFHTQSTIDLTTLSQALPLQEGISIKGKMNADIRLRCRLSSLRNKDLGRIKIGGKLSTEGLAVKDTNRQFELTSNAVLNFIGNDKLGARIQIKNMNLRAPSLNTDIESLQATITSTNPQDTTRIADVECKVEMNRLKTQLTDTLGAFCGHSTATITLQPGKHNPARPQVGLSLKADTLFCRMGETKMGMDKAGIGVTAEQVRDSFWIPKGIVGFNRLKVSTPMCALPIRMQKTSLTVGNRTISLRNATLRIGRSDLTATGAVYDLYGAMHHNKPLRAKLELTSNNLNCNQLIRSLSFPTDTLQAETDTTATNLELFVVPRNVDFELTTRLKRVRYGKMVFKDVRGDVDIRNQAIHLKELSMTGMGAEMRTTLIYQARQRKRGYAGFDFRLHNINIAKLVDFAPSLDSIVPMLRSFQGTVDFDVAAETHLDSCLNIKIPSLRSAIHINGDSLVLMDGETFAEISKKFFFKNKEKNLIDSISVNISVKDGNVTVYPFVIEMDRYRAAVGGTQDLNMNFDYHISILKSPIPFKLGLNIRGNLDKMKFGMGKAKYKDAVTPVEIHKVDSTIVNMGEQIVKDFRRIMQRK
ncbi:AsmA-like C-terminal region-containing protein [uncultured Bacteroides sp.]|mgnify:FL=1|uniref:AsmA family protein n=1 Tax=uncultured Bacteroides sp. TaxID=162156 RepID=UPI00262FF806|nr:AsmA-like C-terminal region-containing protein [uncultured Bacteroides sp.]